MTTSPALALVEAMGSDITLEQLFEQTNKKPRTAILYIRVSSLREIRRMNGEITTETQEMNSRAFAAREGIEVIDVVFDLNISGRREKFLSRKIVPTIERIGKGEADCVIVYNVSRWGRSTIESRLSEVMLWEAGGRLLSATEPNDERTSTGKFTRTQLYAIAELQSDQIGDSWRAAHQNRLGRKLPRDGRPRLGYIYHREEGLQAEYRQDPVVAPLLAQAYRDVINGVSMWQVTRNLRAKGVTMPGKDTLITYMGLRTALDSGFGAGKIIVNTTDKVNGPKFLPGAQEPVITQAEWAAYLKKRPELRKNARPLAPKLALQGHVHCGTCQTRMDVDRRSNGDHRYVCKRNQGQVTSTRKGCALPTGIRAALVDGAVMGWLDDMINNKTKLDQATVDRIAAADRAQANLGSLEKELATHQKIRQNYLRMRAEEKIESDEELDEMMAPVKAKIREIELAMHEAQRQIQVHQLPSMDAFESVLMGFVAKMNGEHLNKALSTVLKGVYVGTGKTASSPGKLDIIGLWEDREPNVFVAKVRGVDHNEGKHCSRCLKFKTAESFYRRTKGRDAGKLSSWCRECQSQYYQNEYRPPRRPKPRATAEPVATPE